MAQQPKTMEQPPPQVAALLQGCRETDGGARRAETTAARSALTSTATTSHTEDDVSAAL
eukprot:CAMPEP_0197913500 /NCGR_PEP_ID=MMETSP1439-20131203/76763_1 /TAXON_ID=66791 /ORGANISM="Gonyaulax spinifera, Strain CCMP409" /LENGTH=58 /DNA_ID=CAMNT_0043535361 /DNA_START=124 /DNA_END=298 /DNA_ORIENTATION=-